MSKINQEEYELLKGLDEEWKWIARDGSGELYIHEEKPKKFAVEWVSERDYYLYLNSETFQFIQWGDENPFSIAELIEEYEKESEETEVKRNIEWLKGEMDSMHRKRDLDRNPDEWFISKTALLKAIDQLDEPEALSQEWIDEHARAVAYDGMPDETEIVYVDDLQNLLVPKHEEMKVPEMWHDVIAQNKEDGHSLRWTLKYIDDLHVNDVDSFARAWIAYPNIEVEEEQKYYLKIGNLYLAEPLGDMTSDIVRMTRDKGIAYQFTDEKSIATHLDKFEGTEAVKVEELEE